MNHETAHRMSPVDTAWLRMDNDVNLMMIVGVWLLDGRLTLAALRQRLGRALLAYPRFRQRVVHDALGGLQWVDDGHFDLEHHVVAERLEPLPGADGPRRALQQRCAELAAMPFDPRHPLWQFHLVEQHEAGSAMIVRIHHCIGDGIALISVMNAITDGGPPPRGAGGGRPGPVGPGAAGRDGPWSVLLAQPLQGLTALAVKAVDWSGEGLARSIGALAHPELPLDGARALSQAALQVARDAATMLAMPDDSPTRLKGPLAGRKRVAWSAPMPLEPVKLVGRAFNASVNDVLLACVSGAIGHWLRAQGDRPDGAEIRAMVPVNLRPLDEAWKLGNRFGLAPLQLPVGIANPVERLYAVRARMAELKHGYQPVLAFGLLALAGLVAQPLQEAMLGVFARKTTAVMTNVPGPRERLHLCGLPVRQSLFWVPASGEVGVGVSIFSYAGSVQFGLIVDEARCADPQAIVDRFEPEFLQLLLLALMLPWGELPPDGEAEARPAAPAASTRRVAQR